MKMIKGVVTLVFFLTGITFSVCAQDDNAMAPEQAQTSPPDYDGSLYHPCEFSLDGAVVGTLEEWGLRHQVINKRDYRWGGSVGANFFFTRYLGIGGDAFALAQHSHSFVDTTTGNLIARFPIGPVAPYIFGGAGYQFEGIDQIVGGGGVGLEVRLVPHFGIFADARYLAGTRHSGFGLGRAGVRLSF